MEDGLQIMNKEYVFLHMLDYKMLLNSSITNTRYILDYILKKEIIKFKKWLKNCMIKEENVKNKWKLILMIKIILLNLMVCNKCIN